MNIDLKNFAKVGGSIILKEGTLFKCVQRIASDCMGFLKQFNLQEEKSKNLLFFWF